MKFLLGFISFIGLIALIINGVYLGGSIAVEIAKNKLKDQEEVINEEIEDNNVTVESVRVYEVYLAKNFKTIVLKVQVEKETSFEVKVFESKISDFDDMQELVEVNLSQYHDISRLLRLDTQEDKGKAITFMVISLSTWLGFLILKKLA